MDLKNVSIVVCTKNSEALLEDCLAAIKKETPECELIVVDADSTDKTKEIAARYADNMVSDQRRGLSYARQLGIDTAKGALVAFVSPDNVVPRDTMLKMISEMEHDQRLAGVQPLTIIKTTKNYWEWSTKKIFELWLNTTGFTDVIGTPCIFRKSIVSVIRYDLDIKGGADDTALCLKLVQAGYTLKKMNEVSFEKQDLDLKSFFARWKFYGSGDHDFYKKYSPLWTLKRKIQSLMHPGKKHLLKGSFIAIKTGNILLIPALFVAVFARYYGWVSKALRS